MTGIAPFRNIAMPLTRWSTDLGLHLVVEVTFLDTTRWDMQRALTIAIFILILSIVWIHIYIIHYSSRTMTSSGISSIGDLPMLPVTSRIVILYLVSLLSFPIFELYVVLALWRLLLIVTLPNCIKRWPLFCSKHRIWVIETHSLCLCNHLLLVGSNDARLLTRQSSHHSLLLAIIASWWLISTLLYIVCCIFHKSLRGCSTLLWIKNISFCQGVKNSCFQGILDSHITLNDL